MKIFILNDLLNLLVAHNTIQYTKKRTIQVRTIPCSGYSNALQIKLTQICCVNYLRIIVLSDQNTKSNTVRAVVAPNISHPHHIQFTCLTQLIQSSRTWMESQHRERDEIWNDCVVSKCVRNMFLNKAGVSTHTYICKYV